MTTQTILILNPGAMGAAIGEQLVGKGNEVLWVRPGRSAASISRAEVAGLTACDSLKDGLARAQTVLSVCPPHAAIDLARDVAGHGFTGAYVDANAISPQTSLQVAKAVAAGGARFTDGGIIGPPPAGERRARLYLSGDNAPALARLLGTDQLSAISLDGEQTAASALKMCFAGWNKARSALLMNLRALAAHHQVDEALLAEWGAMEPEVLRYFDGSTGRSVMGNAAKAWRWSGEMSEIAKTFEAAGLPGGFHHGAAEVFARLGNFKDVAQAPELSELTQSLLKPKGQ